MVFLKGYLYVGAFLHILVVSYGFGGRTGFDVNMSHVFPQSVLEAITLLDWSWKG